MRCQSLAAIFRSRGFQNRFIRVGTPSHSDVNDAIWITVSQDDVGGIFDARATYKALAKAEIKSGVIIVDHYSIDHKWESFLTQKGFLIVAIDDLANRVHECEILIDSNPLSDKRYDGLVPPGALRLLGTDYALLGQNSIDRRGLQPETTETVSQVLVCFGGSSDLRPVYLMLRAAQDARLEGIDFDIIAGDDDAARTLNTVLQTSSEFLGIDLDKVRVSGWVDDLNYRLIQADVAVGAGGSMTWQRLALGVPSVVVAVAANQEPTSIALSNVGLISYLGRLDNSTPTMLADALVDMMLDVANRQFVREFGPNMIDGRGPDRCARAILDRLAERSNEALGESKG